MSKKKKNKEYLEDREKPTEGVELGATTDDELKGEDRKVIDRGDAKLIISGKEKQENDDNQPREILIQPRSIKSVAIKTPDKVDEEEGEEEDEDVVRLQRSSEPGETRIKQDKAKLEKLEAPVDQAEKEETKWGGDIRVGWWVVIAGLGVAVILVVGLVLKYANSDHVDSDLGVEFRSPEANGDPYDGSPRKWFYENLMSCKKDALDIFSKYIDAKSDQERSLLVRMPGEYLEHVSGWAEGFAPRVSGDEHYTWSVADNGVIGYLALDCVDADFMPMRAYFVRDDSGNGLKLDWHASVGWSEVSMKAMKRNFIKSQSEVDQVNLENKKTEHEGKPTLLRCLLTRRNEHYVGSYNELDHSAFMLRSPDRRTHMWGYVARDSQLDEKLRRALDHGRFVVDLKKDHPVIVRVKRSGKDALPSQVEVVELIQSEWVTP